MVIPEIVFVLYLILFQGSKGLLVKRMYYRILEDIRYVMNHFEAAKYVAERKSELSRAWLHLLAFVQGMYPQRRMTGIHVEEDNEVWSSVYSLENQMASIHSLFVAGAASNASLEETYLSTPCGSFGLAKEALGNREFQQACQNWMCIERVQRDKWC